MAFCPEHYKWDQNPKFTPLSEMMSIPNPFICRTPPPPPGKATKENNSNKFYMDLSLYKLAWKIFPAKPVGQLSFSYYETNYYNLINTKYLNDSRRNSLHHRPFLENILSASMNSRTHRVARTDFAHYFYDHPIFSKILHFSFQSHDFFYLNL